MLTYIIDAFNLIYKVEELADSPSPHARLVEFLKANRLTGSPANRVVIVFDGHDKSDVAGERVYEIVFSGPRTADDVIKERVSRARHRAEIVVVSDDRALVLYVKGEGAKVKSVEDFIKNSGRRLKLASDDEKAIDYEERKKINEELERLWVKERK